MNMQVLSSAARRADDDIAVRVENVSKTYGLWSSPGARLSFPMLNLARRVLPEIPSLQRNLKEKTSGIFREFHALQDISLEIKKGESWGVIGVNGSGKSTLLKIISGNLRPSQGTVEVDGKVAILDYSSGLHGEFTGRENVYLKGSILGMSRREIDDKFESIAAFADIGEFINQPVKTYSSGMTARLGFAIMAHVNADIMITDEALAVGDAFFVQKAMHFIRSFISKGTFLFVSHSTNDVMMLCDKAVWLDGGRIRGIGSAKDVCRAYLSSIDERVSQAYLEEQGGASSVSAEKARTEKELLTFSAAQIASIQDYVASPALVREPRPGDAFCYSVSDNMSVERLFDDKQGMGGGKIVSVEICDEESRALRLVRGGETVRLKIAALAERPVRNPIAGFQLKNNRGLTLFANNTSAFTAGTKCDLERGQLFCVEFKFMMPLLAVGDYVVRAGFADGAEDNHAVLDVRHDALLLHCQTSGARHGLIGQPLLGVTVTTQHAPIRAETA